MRWNPFSSENPISIKSEMDKLGPGELPASTQNPQPEISEPVAGEPENASGENKVGEENPELLFDYIDPKADERIGLQTSEPGLQGRLEQETEKKFMLRDIERAMEAKHFSEIQKAIMRYTLEGGYTLEELAKLIAPITPARKGKDKRVIPVGVPYPKERIRQLQAKSERVLKYYFANIRAAKTQKGSAGIPRLEIELKPGINLTSGEIYFLAYHFYHSLYGQLRVLFKAKFDEQAIMQLIYQGIQNEGFVTSFEREVLKEWLILKKDPKQTDSNYEIPGLVYEVSGIVKEALLSYIQKNYSK